MAHQPSQQSYGSNLLLALIVLLHFLQQPANECTPHLVGPNYLYVNELEVPPGRTPDECTAEGKEWVKAIRETGDFRTAWLYIHNTGPMFALYVLVEPKSRASMEHGFEKAMMSLGMMDSPWNWARHTEWRYSRIGRDQGATHWCFPQPHYW